VYDVVPRLDTGVGLFTPTHSLIRLQVFSILEEFETVGTVPYKNPALGPVDGASEAEVGNPQHVRAARFYLPTVSHSMS